MLVFSLAIRGVCGQEQDNVRDYLRQEFQNYLEKTPWEEIYIHTDREEYISGEELWFNIYLIDRQSFKPSLNSRIAYFGLLDTENRPVLQKRILIDNGFGPGQMHLPDTLSSGIYTIVAYTNWMKNFLPSNCFRKDIKIYNAINNNKFKVRLPSVKTAGKEMVTRPGLNPAGAGITLKINDKPDVLEISVSADTKYRTGNGDLFYLVIQTHGNIDRISPETITEENTKIAIPKKSLTGGINQVTIFDSKGEPVCERYAFNPGMEHQTIAILTDSVYREREKITLDIDPGDSFAGAVNSVNFSISVAPETSINDGAGLDNYLIFGTEFSPLVSNLSASRKIGEIPAEALDTILMNVRSNWIDWKRILSDTLHHFKYGMEKEDHFLSGELLTSDGSSSDSSEIVLLFMPGRKAGFQYAKTDNEGNFTFNIHIDEEKKDFIIMPDDTGNNQKIIIRSPFIDKYEQYETKVHAVDIPLPSFIADWSVNYQVEKIYGVSNAGDTLDPVFLPLRPVRFYGKPDIELVMADYITLDEMKEIFFELLPHVALKKKKSDYEISITDRVYDSWYQLLPDMLLDGVRINDPSIIAALDPRIVERIDVVKEEYLVGKYSFPGIINVTTKSADFTTVPLPDHMIRLPYRVIDPLLSFASPAYSSTDLKNSAVPDFRNTLYWNPSVKPGNDGKVRVEFWTSDVVSDYIINLQGITPGGKIISATKSFTVK